MKHRRTRLRPTALWLLVVCAPWAAVAEPTTVTITRAGCLRLVEHVPDVEYQAGVDVRGRTVAPADLNGGTTLAVPDTIEIEIEVDLFDRFGIPADPDLFEADAQIGTAVVEPDGRAFFNGQPLQDEAQFELTRRCQEIFYGRR